MIISASYKTDIPAFYGEWLINRLDAGYCKVVNPYNGRVGRVPLDRASVDGIVFWTKNAGPFLRRLESVAERGFPFVVQYTINGYPRVLESAVTDASLSIRHVRHISQTFGRRVPVWRYDTILFSTVTPHDFHIDNFTRIARLLGGAVDEVVISFAHLYDKTRRNLKWAASEYGFDWYDPPASEKCDLVGQLHSVAIEYGLNISLCAQPDYAVHGASEARCIDAARLSDVAGHTVRARVRGNREQCGCFEARDIGEYNTCPQGCVYCYAVANSQMAKERYAGHDPQSEFLFPPPVWAKEDEEHRQHTQLPLL